MVREICMIENFILPNLIDETFGNLLEWVDKEKCIFKVFWSHKSQKTWKEKYFTVFIEWDRMKGRTDHSSTEYFTTSKGRFRSALNRLCKQGKIKSLRSSVIGYKLYQLLDVQVPRSPVHVPEGPDIEPVSPPAVFYNNNDKEEDDVENFPEDFQGLLDHLMPDYNEVAFDLGINMQALLPVPEDCLIPDFDALLPEDFPRQLL